MHILMPSNRDITMRTVWDMTAVMTHHSARSSFFIIDDEDFFTFSKILGDALGGEFRKRSGQLTRHIDQEDIFGSLGVLGVIHK